MPPKPLDVGSDIPKVKKIDYGEEDRAYKVLEDPKLDIASEAYKKAKALDRYGIFDVHEEILNKSEKIYRLTNYVEGLIESQKSYETLGIETNNKPTQGLFGLGKIASKVMRAYFPEFNPVQYDFLPKHKVSPLEYASIFKAEIEKTVPQLYSLQGEMAPLVIKKNLLFQQRHSDIETEKFKAERALSEEKAMIADTEAQAQFKAMHDQYLESYRRASEDQRKSILSDVETTVRSQHISFIDQERQAHAQVEQERAKRAKEALNRLNATVKNRGNWAYKEERNTMAQSRNLPVNRGSYDFYQDFLKRSN